MRVLTACSAVFSIATVVYAQTGPQAAKIPACVVSPNSPCHEICKQFSDNCLAALRYQGDRNDNVHECRPALPLPATGSYLEQHRPVCIVGKQLHDTSPGPIQ